MSEGASLIRTLIVASRPVSWINTAYPFAVAYVLTTGRVDALLMVGSLFFLVPYNLAMYGVNDVFDYASDLANPRKGGAEGAKLPPRLHRATLVSSVVVCAPFVAALVVLGAHRPLSWAVLAFGLFAVAAYSVPGLRFKEVPLVDSITSSTHFVAPALYGLVVAGTTVTPALVVTMVAFFCWGMASHAFGAVQDVLPDRRAGIRSIATALGAAGTVRLAMSLWTVAGLLMLLTPWPARLAALAAVPYLAAVAGYARVSDERSATANRAWRRFLVINYAVGFVLTLLIIVCATEGLFS